MRLWPRDVRRRRGLVIGACILGIYILVPLWAELTADNEIGARPPFLDIYRRSAVLFFAFAPIVLSAPALLVPYGREHVFEPVFVRSLERAGAAFIKLGQWASTRPDLLPRSFCEALSKLQSGAPQHSWAVTRAAVEHAIGGRIESKFPIFNKEPAASGSIGQVHFAETIRGLPVAVKVRHPHVVSQMRTDFYLLSCFATTVHRLPGLSWLDLKSVVGQFGSVLQDQSRLDIEAKNLMEARRNFRRWNDVKVPRVLFSSPAVIVETRMMGRTIGSYVREGARGLIPRDQRLFIVRRGVDIYLQMLLVDNVMHADFHPGNIMYDVEAHSIGLIDFGLVARLSRTEQKYFIGFLRHLATGDGEAAARCLLGWSDKQACSSRNACEAFIADVVAEYKRICRGYRTGTNLGEVLRSTLTLVRKHHVSIGGNYMTLVVNALCLESMAKELDPTYNVLDAAHPLLVVSEMLHAPSPLFRAHLPMLKLFKSLMDLHDARKVKRLPADVPEF